MTSLENDTRMLRRNLAKGFLSGKEYDELLDALPDVAEKAEYVDIEDPEDAEDADDAEDAEDADASGEAE